MDAFSAIPVGDTVVAVKDRSGNVATVEYYGSIESAILALESLHNCRNCHNCTDCYNCHGCRNCFESDGCHNCTDCDNCTDCYNCHNCKGRVERRDLFLQQRKAPKNAAERKTLVREMNDLFWEEKV